MNKSDQEKGAKILPLVVKREIEEYGPSEIARNLFAETWRIYLDEPPMKSISVKNASGADFKSKQEDFKIDQSELPLRLYFKD